MNDEFHSIDYICKSLSIPKATWASYIRDGVITKQAQGKYNGFTVAQEIIRDQRRNIRSSIADKSNLTMKLNKAQDQLTQLKGVEIDEDGVRKKPLTEKEKIDLALQKQKLRKIKHENNVREKQVMPVDNVFEFVTSISSEFSAFLDPLVGKIKQILPDMNARTHDEISKLFARGRNDLSRHVEGKTTNELIELFNPDSGEFDDDE
jgi:hypothetical protein